MVVEIETQGDDEAVVEEVLIQDGEMEIVLQEVVEIVEVVVQDVLAGSHARDDFFGRGIVLPAASFFACSVPFLGGFPASQSGHLETL